MVQKWLSCCDQLVFLVCQYLHLPGAHKEYYTPVRKNEVLVQTGCKPFISNKEVVEFWDNSKAKSLLCLKDISEKYSWPKEVSILAIKLPTISNTHASIQKTNKPKIVYDKTRKQNVKSPNFPKANPRATKGEEIKSHSGEILETVVVTKVTNQMNKSLYDFKDIIE